MRFFISFEKELERKGREKESLEFRKKEVEIESSSINCHAMGLKAIGFCILHLLFRF